MSEKPLAIRTLKNRNGAVEYHLAFDSEWAGLDSFVRYLQQYWQAEVSEAVDSIYSRRWVMRVDRVFISVCHDSQIGNFFVREDGVGDQALLEKITADLIERFV